MDKESIIERMCFDPAGLSSIKETLKDAKRVDNTITYDDVKQWKQNSFEIKRQLNGYNSFVAAKAYQEFQIDTMFCSDFNDSFSGGLLLVDLFINIPSCSSSR